VRVVFRDVLGHNPAAIRQDNRIGRRGRTHGKQQTYRQWSFGAHNSILPSEPEGLRRRVATRCPNRHSPLVQVRMIAPVALIVSENETPDDSPSWQSFLDFNLRNGFLGLILCRPK
jgi:hypothetical protein